MCCDYVQKKGIYLVEGFQLIKISSLVILSQSDIMQIWVLLVAQDSPRRETAYQLDQPKSQDRFGEARISTPQFWLH